MYKNIGRKPLLLTALILLALMCQTAFAEGSLRVSLSVSPTALVGPGEVKVSLSLENTGFSTIEDISLDAQTGRNYNFTDIEPGDKKSFKLDNFPVNEYQIGEPIDFIFSYTEDMFQQQYVTQLTVEQKTAKPDMTVTREASTLSANAGDEITLTYTLKNTGDVDLYNIDITDEISSTPIAQGLFLAAGDKVKTVPYTFTMEKTVQSSPKIAAQSEGGDLNLTVEPIQIKLTEPFIDVIITKKGADDAGTKLDITLNNTGNVAISALTVTDETGAIIADAFSLEPGKGKSFSYDLPKSPTTRMFWAKAVGSLSDEAGTKVEFSSEEVEIPPIISQEEVGLDVEVTADNSMLEAPGTVNVTIALNNTGSAELTNLVVKEAIAGEIRRIDRLPPGTESFTIALQFNQSSDLNITVTAQDILENDYTFNAKSLRIDVTPQVTPPPEDENKGISWSMWLFIGVGILLALCIVALIAVLLREKRHKQRSAEADDAMEILNRQEDVFEQELHQTPRTARQPKITQGQASAYQNPKRAPAKQSQQYRPDEPHGYRQEPPRGRYERDPLSAERFEEEYLPSDVPQRFHQDAPPPRPAQAPKATPVQPQPRKRPVLKNEPATSSAHSVKPNRPADDSDILEDEFLND